MHPTPYPTVNTTLDRLRDGLTTLLGPNLVGLYVHGSLASGGFKEGRSDIDFLALIDTPLTPDDMTALGAFFQDMAATDPLWGNRLEGPFMTRAELRRYDPDHIYFPSVRVEEAFGVHGNGVDWVMQRHILREQAIILHGPPLHDYIDPIPQAALIQAVREVLGDWWTQQYRDPSGIRDREYQVFGVLSMCRALYALRTGVLGSKIEAGAWALGALPAEWHPAIERALAYPDEPQPDDLPTTVAFIGYTLGQV